MKDMEKELKMKLLEQLMAEMDGSIGKKLGPKEEPIVEVESYESKEMPMSDAEEMLKDKLMGKEEESEEEMEEIPSEEAMMDEEEDDDDYSSNMMRRLQELRKKKSME